MCLYTRTYMRIWYYECVLGASSALPCNNICFSLSITRSLAMMEHIQPDRTRPTYSVTVWWYIAGAYNA